MASVAEFQERILGWYEENGRDLPWRRTEDLYEVMVSEFMLQQTQVSRVEVKFVEFLEKFPTVGVLAAAARSEVIRAWQGLGYNRRAVFLHESAKKAVAEYGGELPRVQERLIEFPGIGPYMSRSVLIFALNQDLATVDTNIRRIFIAEDFAHEDMKEKELFALAEELLPHGRSRDWHNGLMDYGASVVTARGSGIRPVSRQGKFEGSFRSFRSKLVKELVANETVALGDVAGVLEKDDEFARKVVDSLLRDKLVALVDGVVSLPE